jgi:hypothetical protein
LSGQVRGEFPSRSESDAGLRRGSVSSVRFSPDGSLLVSGSSPFVWDVYGSKELQLSPELSSRFFSGGFFSDDGRLFTLRSSSAKIGIIEVATLKLIKEFDIPDYATKIAFSPDGTRMITYFRQRYPLIYDLFLPELARAETPDSMKNNWTALRSNNPLVARQAVLQLATGGDESVKFLAARLAPRKLNVQIVRESIAQLGHQSFRIREEASNRLVALGPACNRELRRALIHANSAEVRHRILRVLAEISPIIQSQETLQTVRAIEVLDRVGTSGAMAVLRKMSSGAPEAHETRAAKSAIWISKTRKKTIGME